MGPTRPQGPEQIPWSPEQDWLAELPAEKRALFDCVVAPVESCYGMLSVALDQAFALREQASLVCAREQVGMAAELVERFAGRLAMVLETISGQSRSLPEVSPLDADFFRGEATREAATWSRIRHRLLPSRRWRCGGKLRDLRDILLQLAGGFQQRAEEIAEGSCTEPARRWGELEEIHYDLNTCLRETIVVWKSFLRTLPAADLAAFEACWKRASSALAAPLSRRRDGVAPLST